ncbi:MAG: hypothetical protein ACK4NE_02390 [Albidovulum sp.]
MQIKRRAITAGTTFFLAAATGHVMQNGETISARLRGDAAPKTHVLAGVISTAGTVTPAPAAGPISDPAPVTVRDPAATQPAPADAEALITAATISASAPMKGAEQAVPVSSMTRSGLPDLPHIEPVALGSDLRLAGRIGALETGYIRAKSAADANYSVFGIACADPQLELESSARGMVKLTLAAPCFANERVMVTHAGLAVAMATDATGDLSIILPALASPARVDVRFATGETVSASQLVTGLDSLARIGIQWQGAEGFRLHAFENGAGFDMPGHVSAAAPRDRATGEGGFLTVLGDPTVDHPLMAEIYTAPAGTVLSEILVEAPVTSATCGRMLAGQALRLMPGAAAASETVSVAMPGCDAVGDSVMLGLASTAVPDVAMVAAGN